MSSRPKEELEAAWRAVDDSKSLGKAQLRDILVLTRILLEQEDIRGTYPVLDIYCDWVVHAEIDRHDIGKDALRTLSQNMLHVRRGEHLIPNPITGEIDQHSIAAAALSKMWGKALRRDWLEFNANRNVPVNVLNSYNGWHYLLRVLLESLVERPITLGPFGSDGLPTKRSHLALFNEMLRSASADRQLVPLWLRIERGAAFVSVDATKLPDSDTAYHLRALSDGYVWRVHSLPDTDLVILITDDEARPSFLLD